MENPWVLPTSNWVEFYSPSNWAFIKEKLIGINNNIAREFYAGVLSLYSDKLTHILNVS